MDKQNTQTTMINPSPISVKKLCIIAFAIALNVIGGHIALLLHLPVFLFQGIVTVLAKLIMPVMTDLALADLSMVGSVLIFCVGLNLIRDKKIPVANMLPAILFAIGFSFIPGLN